MGSSCFGAVETNPTSIQEDVGSILDLAQWISSPVLLELWCRLPMQLGSGIAVAVVQAGSYNSDQTPSLAWEPSYAVGVALKSKTNKQTNNSKYNKNNNYRKINIRILIITPKQVLLQIGINFKIIYMSFIAKTITWIRILENYPYIQIAIT